MVIVLKVSFSPARERILLTGSVQRDSPEPEPRLAISEEALLSQPRQDARSATTGSDKVPIAREPPTLLP